MEACLQSAHGHNSQIPHLQELEKLKLANKIANELLERREKYHLSQSIANQNKELSRIETDIWGATNVLKGDKQLKYAQEFLNFTSHNLKRNYCLKNIARKASYQEVDDVTQLSNVQSDDVTHENKFVTPVTVEDWHQPPNHDEENSEDKKFMKVEKSSLSLTDCDKEKTNNLFNATFQNNDEFNCSTTRSLKFANEKEVTPSKTLCENFNVTELRRSTKDPGIDINDTVEDTSIVNGLLSKILQVDEKEIKKLCNKKHVKNVEPRKIRKLNHDIKVGEKETIPPIVEKLNFKEIVGFDWQKLETPSSEKKKSKIEIEPKASQINRFSKPTQPKVKYENKNKHQISVKPQKPSSPKLKSLNFQLRHKQESHYILPKYNVYANKFTHTYFDWSNLSDEVILNIFSYLHKEDLLNIMNVNADFYRIANDSSLWTTVDFKDETITATQITCFSKKCPETVSFTKSRYRNITNSHLRSFFASCKRKLKSVFVSQCQIPILSGDNILLHVSSRCSEVENVHVPWSNTTDNGLAAISDGASMLKKLNISGNAAITDQSFTPLLTKHKSSITHLEMSGCFAIKINAIKLISDCQNLTVLDLGLLTKLESNEIINLCAKLKNLRKLNLRGVKAVTDNCIHNIVFACDQIEDFVIAKCDAVSDTGIKEISTYLPKLHTLDISGCSYVTDDGILALALNLEHLKNLNISSTGITHISVNVITENCYSSIEELKLNFCHNITKNSIENLISFCYLLKNLQLFGCKRLNVKNINFNNGNLKIES